MTQRETDRAERRRQIQDITRAMLEVEPYERVSIEKIAARVGISVGAIYLHFRTKDDLLVSMLETADRAQADPGPAEWAALLRLASAGLDRVSAPTLEAARLYVRQLHRRLPDAFLNRLGVRAAVLQAA